VHLLGGRGNMYFQINAAISIARTSNFKKIIFVRFDDISKDFLLDIDLEIPSPWRSDFSFQSVCLRGNFSTFLRKVLNLQLRIALKNSLSSKTILKILALISKILFFLFFRENIRIFVSNNLGYVNTPIFHTSVFIVGYFQSALYGNYISEMYRGHMYNDGVVHANRIMLHIRRGDYRINPNLGMLTPKYYKNILQNCISDDFIEGIDIYSDEKITVRDYEDYLGQFFKDREVRIFDAARLNSRESFAQMIQGYRYYVIANSSFSFWAAMIGANSSTTVFCPNPWFKGVDTPIRIYGEGWFSVDSEFIE
jgi:hypothetical protein